MNLEIDAIVRELVEQASVAVRFNSPIDKARVEELASSLVLNGWYRKQSASTPLQILIEHQMKADFRDVAKNRGAIVRSIAAEVSAICESIRVALDESHPRSALSN